MKSDWIRELANHENRLEETGVFEQPPTLNRDYLLSAETIQFLTLLKNQFIQAATTFNQFKHSPHGRIKVYGIAKTYSDFMLFRNGFKMVFSQKEPGLISIRYNFMVTNPVTTSDAKHNTSSIEEHLLKAKMSPFGDVTWTFEDCPVTLESVVRYHLTLFVRESTQ
ncbi:MAG: hypothetical protein NZ480_01645 [Bdellovibrionaceae bacterium]|nr:hypothetical protein [Pseudobdellovibrionaceae bacterium]MDW8189823.1 hypothetical protein [Pseudobdellovibrionaceae bacterium]